jgi:hypothetical protein
MVQADDAKALGGSVRIDVCHWINRATFDVIGLAGWLSQIPRVTSLNSIKYLVLRF